MILKILICDDDINFINQLKCDIETYFHAMKQDICISEKSNDFMSVCLDDYHIVFMDIDLSHDKIDGISLAELLKTNNPHTLIVFTSARNELVFKTFRVGGFQFIRKNHYQYDFEETMNQLKEYINKNMSYVILMVNGRKKKVHVNDIKYIMSIGHDMIIHCYDAELVIRSSIKKTLEMLGSKKLIQIQRNVAVNLDYVHDFVKWKVVCGKEEFVIGRKFQKDFQESFENYLIHHNGCL